MQVVTNRGGEELGCQCDNTSSCHAVVVKKGRETNKQNELNNPCEGHRFNGLKLVKKSEIGP